MFSLCIQLFYTLSGLYLWNLFYIHSVLSMHAFHFTPKVFSLFRQLLFTHKCFSMSVILLTPTVSLSMHTFHFTFYTYSVLYIHSIMFTSTEFFICIQLCLHPHSSSYVFNYFLHPKYSLYAFTSFNTNIVLSINAFLFTPKVFSLGM